jgi:hypothetical protein
MSEMTSFKQIEANRRNALSSTGPKTAEGRQRSRVNATRHGLTAETVISFLEDAEDYQAFEAAVLADYDAQSTVELELITRLASVLWRLRRATAIETSLFEMQADPLAGFRKFFQNTNSSTYFSTGGDHRSAISDVAIQGQNRRSNNKGCASIAENFLRLANLPSFAFDRISRYETSLWRQAHQIMAVLRALRGGS